MSFTKECIGVITQISLNKTEPEKRRKNKRLKRRGKERERMRGREGGGRRRRRRRKRRRRKKGGGRGALQVTIRTRIIFGIYCDRNKMMIWNRTLNLSSLHGLMATYVFACVSLTFSLLNVCCASQFDNFKSIHVHLFRCTMTELQVCSVSQTLQWNVKIFAEQCM